MKPFKIYRSSAGSGKTHTLVKEYLNLVLTDKSDYRFAKILAVTFTNKAAEEMKERVIQNLYILSLPVSHINFNQKYLNEIANFTGLNSLQIHEKAAKVFKTMLHNYHLLKITTIDKFTISLVNGFANEIGIDTGTQIETDVDLIMQIVVNELLEDSGKDKFLTKVMLKFYDEVLDDGEKFDIKKALVAFAKIIWDEKGYLAIEQLKLHSAEEFVNAYDNANDFLKKCNTSTQTHAKKILSLFENAEIDYSYIFNAGRGIISFINDCCVNELDELEVKSTLIKFINGSYYSKAATSQAIASFEKIKEEVLSLINQILEFIEKNKVNYILHKAIKKNAFSMALLKQLTDKVESYKSQNGIMFLNEYNRLISNLVKDEPASFIYERYSERLKNIFVDEFQDTSTLQFTNLIPLLEESISKNEMVLLVGDAKQSIYRWRNSNVQQFIDLPELDTNITQNNPYRSKQFRNACSTAVLPINYRSSKEIIEFNNLFFKAILDLPEFTQNINKAYLDIVQEIPSGKSGGYIRLRKFDKTESKSTLCDDEIEKFLMEGIHNAIENNYSYNQICILVRTNKEGEFVYRILNKYGIDVSSAQALALNSSAEIKFIITFIQTMLSGIQPVLFRKLAFELAVIKNQVYDLENTITHLSKSFNQALAEFLKLFQIDFDLYKYKTYNLIEKVKYIITICNFSMNNAFIVTFLEHVHAQMLHYGSDENLFIEWWNQSGYKKSIQSGQRENAVSIMTIHKAKGLQFPIVFIPFVQFDKKNNSDKTYEWITDVNDIPISPVKLELTKRLENTWLFNLYTKEKELKLMDSLNLLYVALTRAETELHVFIDTSVSGGFQTYIENALNNVFNFKSGWMTIGNTEKLNKRVSKYKSNELIIANDVEFKSWHNKLQVSTGTNNENSNEARLRGVKLHQIMAEITSQGDIKVVADKYLKKGILQANELTSFINDLNDVFSNNNYNYLINNYASCLNEIDITDGKGNIYRPDKIFINDNEAFIVDFKSGNEQQAHLDQVKNYMEIIKSSGYKSVKGGLYYFNTKNMIFVQ